MKNNLTVSTETQNLIAYFILAYAISWAIGVPLALGNQGLIHPIFPAWTHYFVAYGPMLSALIVTWASRGRTGLKELGKRMVMW